MNVLWIAMLCHYTICVSLGVAYPSLATCEQELTPSPVFSMLCAPQEGI